MSSKLLQIGQALAFHGPLIDRFLRIYCLTPAPFCRLQRYSATEIQDNCQVCARKASTWVTENAQLGAGAYRVVTLAAERCRTGVGRIAVFLLN